MNPQKSGHELRYNENKAVKTARKEARKAVAVDLVRITSDFIMAAAYCTDGISGLQKIVFEHCKELEELADRLEHGKH